MASRNFEISKLTALGTIYLFCTMSTCLSFFRNASHANYIGKYAKGKNLIWVNRSFHDSTFTWDSFWSNRYFLRAFKYFVLTLQFYKFMNVVTWVTWPICPAIFSYNLYISLLRFLHCIIAVWYGNKFISVKIATDNMKLSTITEAFNKNRWKFYSVSIAVIFWVFSFFFFFTFFFLLTIFFFVLSILCIFLIMRNFFLHCAQCE